MGNVPENWMDLDNLHQGNAALVPLVHRNLLQGGGEADHRARLGSRIAELAALLTARADPRLSACSADTTVSSSTFISVTGMAQEVYVPLAGALDIEGALYVEELTAGSFSARVVNGASVLWTVTVQNQASVLLSGSGAQFSKWVVPIGGPDLLTTVDRTEYSLDVEIAAPSGSYKVLTGSGAESAVRFSLHPDIVALE